MNTKQKKLIDKILKNSILEIDVELTSSRLNNAPIAFFNSDKNSNSKGLMDLVLCTVENYDTVIIHSSCFTSRQEAELDTFHFSEVRAYMKDYFCTKLNLK